MSESDKSYNIIAKRCYKPSMDGNKAPFVNFQKRMKKRLLSERRTMYRFLMFLPFIIVIIRYLFLKKACIISPESTFERKPFTFFCSLDTVGDAILRDFGDHFTSAGSKSIRWNESDLLTVQVLQQ